MNTDARLGRDATPLRRLLGLALLAAATLTAGPPSAPEGGGAQRLAALHATLAPRLAASPLQRPLLIESSERAETTRADVYALLPQPLHVIEQALQQPAQWCQALELHLYVKRCRAAPGALTLHVATRHDQPPDSAPVIALAFVRETEAAGYLKVVMRADKGPLGTRHVDLVFEAVAAGPAASFVHFGYQAGATAIGQWAMQAYLATRGRDKVGFSAAPDDGRPGTIGGARGVIERNAMRYQLAIESYLGTLASPEATRFEQRLAAWFDATEQFPRQLHEVNRADYLASKRRELLAEVRPAGG